MADTMMLLALARAFGSGDKQKGMPLAYHQALSKDGTTRPCSQCHKPVPLAQTLKTCQTCRDGQKRKKARRRARLQGSDDTEPGAYDEEEEEEPSRVTKAKGKGKRKAEAEDEDEYVQEDDEGEGSKETKGNGKGKGKGSGEEMIGDETVAACKARLKREFAAAQANPFRLTKAEERLEKMLIAEERRAIQDMLGSLGAHSKQPSGSGSSLKEKRKNDADGAPPPKKAKVEPLVDKAVASKMQEPAKPKVQDKKPVPTPAKVREISTSASGSGKNRVEGATITKKPLKPLGLRRR